MLTLCCGAIYLASELAGRRGRRTGGPHRGAAGAAVSDRHAIGAWSRAASSRSSCADVPREPRGARWSRLRQPAAADVRHALGGRANLLAVAWCFRSGGARPRGARPAARDRRRRDRAERSRPVSPALRRGLVGAGAPLRARSPFHYYEGMRTLIGMRSPAWTSSCSWPPAWRCWVVAYVLYVRRDL